MSQWLSLRFFLLMHINWGKWRPRTPVPNIVHSLCHKKWTWIFMCSTMITITYFLWNDQIRVFFSSWPFQCLYVILLESFIRHFCLMNFHWLIWNDVKMSIFFTFPFEVSNDFCSILIGTYWLSHLLADIPKTYGVTLKLSGIWSTGNTASNRLKGC